MNNLFKFVVSLCVLTSLLAAQVSATQESETQPPPGGLKIAILSGEGAVNYAKARTGREVIVRVTDENNRPVGGAAVTFTMPAQGASGTFASGTNTLTTLTNAQGQAVASGIHANSAIGSFQIHVGAAFQGHTAVATVTQTNAAAVGSAGATAHAGISGKVIAVLAAVAAGTAAGVVAATRGGHAPSVTSATVTPGAIVFGPPK
jgi:hypothetical protein